MPPKPAPATDPAIDAVLAVRHARLVEELRSDIGTALQRALAERDAMAERLRTADRRILALEAETSAARAQIASLESALTGAKPEPPRVPLTPEEQRAADAKHGPDRYTHWRGVE